MSKGFTPDSGIENILSFKEVWSWNEIESFVIFSTIRMKGEVNFFIREILKVFYFRSAFIVVML